MHREGSCAPAMPRRTPFVCLPLQQELFKRALKEADKAAVITQPAPELREPLPWKQAAS